MRNLKKKEKRKRYNYRNICLLIAVQTSRVYVANAFSI